LKQAGVVQTEHPMLKWTVRLTHDTLNIIETIQLKHHNIIVQLEGPK